jgi:hypothetical protein
MALLYFNYHKTFFLPVYLKIKLVQYTARIREERMKFLKQNSSIHSLYEIKPSMCRIKKQNNKKKTLHKTWEQKGGRGYLPKTLYCYYYHHNYSYQLSLMSTYHVTRHVSTDFTYLTSFTFSLLKKLTMNYYPHFTK